MYLGLRMRLWRKQASRNVVTATLTKCDGSQTLLSLCIL